VQDDRLAAVLTACGDGFPARLRLFRLVARRRRGASVTFLKAFLTDPDERLVRMAAREIVRRRPPDFENTLLQLMTSATPTVRRVVSRAVGKAGFDHFWAKFDRLPKATRKQAGRAMLKLLPDAPQMLRRRLGPGPLERRLKALQMVHELGLADAMRDVVLALCQDGDARVRSKAVLVAGEVANVTPDALIDRLLHDADARVRANTIEVLESKADARFLPVLTERARAASNRERANAIKALFRMRVSTVSGQLFTMLRDGRPEHRISAMWALRQIGWWQLIGEVGRLAKQDENVRVRRYAITLLKGVAEAAAARAKAG
jgi:HEAT repeat protein